MENFNINELIILFKFEIFIDLNYLFIIDKFLFNFLNPLILINNLIILIND